ncbi:DUF2278 family protein [Spiroplasma eriocheiris]|nr:DUF2278 family protein [Spiroplasma eriocheiris]AHF57560.1 hypothetical protein SPE_0431 [Spiroplasma eriocheiris CCTCC M 207170]
MMNSYALLKGQVIQTTVEGISSYNKSPHYIIKIYALAQVYEVAINVYSKIAPHNLKYYFAHEMNHPILNKAINIPEGEYRNLPTGSHGIAIDYLRSGIFDINDMKVLPLDPSNESQALEIMISKHLASAINNPNYKICVWGKIYSNKIPGIHDVHMNQGNSDPRYRDENGIWQDGALIIVDEQHNTIPFGCFFAFQSQAIKTDDNGDPL